jgi:hypothetical protein
MGTISLQSDPILPYGYLKVNGVTAATLTTTGLSGVLYRPATASNGHVLTFNGSQWVASPISLAGGDISGSLPNPTVIKIQGISISNTAPTTGQVLAYNGSSWAAGAVPNPYTTVGNASAGIFVSAVCFIPSSPGTGTWTAPAGCFSARVTVVGGGGYMGNPGGRSHFNYPSGSTTGANQLFASGGSPSFGGGVAGGSAGWNGVNDVAIGGNANGAGGTGGSGGGGYGGGGGAVGNAVVGSGSGGSYGGPGTQGTPGGGGSGGISGSGTAGSGIFNAFSLGGTGGGGPMLSYAAALLPTFSRALSQNVGRGDYSGGGAGWCSAIVSVTPGQSYSYAVGAGALGASYGMVVIEW